jgi:hypothetical protein
MRGILKPLFKEEEYWESSKQAWFDDFNCAITQLFQMMQIIQGRASVPDEGGAGSS